MASSQDPLTRSAEEWRERGAASVVRKEVDSKGQVHTVAIKKGVKDFDFGRTLGTGSYSTVVCGSDKQTLRKYAIKVLDKRHIIKEKKVKYVEIEKRTLNRLGDHPGIIPLYYTFQDEGSLYFVLDYAANGELLSLIKRLGSLSEECVRYYGAQLLDAIEFMHSQGVLHRDIKPENILLDDYMRIKVTDFGTAKLINRERDTEGKELESYPQDTRASSFVGTAEYVSPELLSDKYVTKSCDWWAFGCVVYQMLAGRPPFKGKNEYQTFQKIIKLQYSFQPGFPTVLRDLIKHILVVNPERRYVSAQIRAHPFFEGQNWSRNAVWKTEHPRLLPYRPQSRTASNPLNRIQRPGTGPGINGMSAYSPGVARNKSSAAALAGVNPKASSSPNLLHLGPNGASAAAGAAAALAKPPSSITAYPSPTQVYAGKPVTTTVASSNGKGSVNGTPQSNQAGANSSHSASTPASPMVVRVIPRVPVTPSPRIVAKPQPQSQQPLSHPPQPPAVSQYLQQPPSPTLPRPQSSNAPKPATAPASTAATPVSSNQQQQAVAVPAVKRMEIPPFSNTDKEFQMLLGDKDERILKIGNVTMTVTSAASAVHPHPSSDGQGSGYGNNGSASYDAEDYNREPGRISRMFAGTRKKKRIMFVTTVGRLVVITSVEEKKVHLDIRVVAPQVVIREFAHNRKTNVGVFAVEAHNKVFTFEDPGGSADWMAAIGKARAYVHNAEAVYASKTHHTAAAAAMAAAASSVMRAGTAGVGGTASAGGSPQYQSQAQLPPPSQMGRRSSDMDGIITGTNSLFLRRHEERKLRKVI